MIPRTTAACLFATIAPAQAWAVTAVTEVQSNASVQLQNVAPGATQTHTLPALTNVSAGFTLAAATNAAGSQGQCHVDWRPSFAGQIAPVGFLAFTGSYVSVSSGIPWSIVSADASTTFLVHVSVPAPTSGRLALRLVGSQSQIGVPHPRLEADVLADGSWEVDVSSSSFGYLGSTWYSELPVVVGANGFDVRVRLTDSTFASFPGGGLNFASASLAMYAEFHPGQAVVAPFDFTGYWFFLGSVHHPDDTVLLSIQQPWPAVMVFGATPLVAPVPGIPTITQLVSVDAFAIARSLTLPMPALPPGSAIHAQCFALDTSGVLRSSNSVRAWWP